MYPIVLALLSALLFGASTPIGKWLLESLPPFQLAGWLYLGAAVGVAPGILMTRNTKTAVGHMGKKNLQRLAGAIGFGGVAGPVLLLMGLQRSSAASVSLWLNLELVATALLGFIVFRDHLGRNGWVGVAGTILASVLLSWHGGRVGVSALLLVACACICWGLDNHLTALIDGITPAQSTFWKGLVAGGVNIAIGLSVEKHGAGIGSASVAMIVGAFAYGFSITLYIKSAHYLGATRSQMIFSSAPFFGLALAVPLLGEKIVPIQAIAAGILIVSLVLLFRDQHAHTHIHKPSRHQHDHNHADPHHGHDHPGAHPDASHDHVHRHPPMFHSHPHWPDIHHRHKH
ncbi:MAG: EamA family transporter [Desulfobacteraceae bacterium]|jgi:drug/metabolite transporter (DMT)-like permease